MLEQQWHYLSCEKSILKLESWTLTQILMSNKNVSVRKLELKVRIKRTWRKAIWVKLIMMRRCFF